MSVQAIEHYRKTSIEHVISCQGEGIEERAAREATVESKEDLSCQYVLDLSAYLHQSYIEGLVEAIMTNEGGPSIRVVAVYK